MTKIIGICGTTGVGKSNHIQEYIGNSSKKCYWLNVKNIFETNVFKNEEFISEVVKSFCDPDITLLDNTGNLDYWKVMNAFSNNQEIFMALYSKYVDPIVKSILETCIDEYEVVFLEENNLLMLPMTNYCEVIIDYDYRIRYNQEVGSISFSRYHTLNKCDFKMKYFVSGFMKNHYNTYIFVCDGEEKNINHILSKYNVFFGE